MKNILSREKNKTSENKYESKSINQVELVDEILSESIETIKVYDSKKLESILLNASAKLTQPVLIEEVVIP